MAGEDAVRLRPPRNAVDRRAVGWWRAQCLLGTAVPVAVPAVLGVLIGPARTWLLAAAAVLAALGLACTAFFPAWWYRVHRWEVTDEAVYVRTGALWQEWRIAPMSRIQTVDTVRGPLEQLFGLATLTVTTASSKGALRVEGLDHELAAELAERLTALTRATPGDAT
ncbi:PH domain-containing protein [Streptomyces sp. R302]|uniref:PH domain-containing protein n=1 Tax=unclassified Streptomyces TaxID=2593676 RepID=UPI00145CD4B2|nr:MULTISPECIES: PH domain-containing protein [unclassified Streptomyces]NML49761.1 PH domain-containing protein [Streptomyces sp. R301]NML78088.1 PH domain-containing protein [Streptomyces sp. R302]